MAEEKQFTIAVTDEDGTVVALVKSCQRSDKGYRIGDMALSGWTCDADGDREDLAGLLDLELNAAWRRRDKQGG